MTSDAVINRQKDAMGLMQSLRPGEFPVPNDYEDDKMIRVRPKNKRASIYEVAEAMGAFAALNNLCGVRREKATGGEIWVFRKPLTEEEFSVYERRRLEKTLERCQIEEVGPVPSV